jgi:hypothetical protein
MTADYEISPASFAGVDDLDASMPSGREHR